VNSYKYRNLNPFGNKSAQQISGFDLMGAFLKELAESEKALYSDGTHRLLIKTNITESADSHVDTALFRNVITNSLVFPFSW
jgi:hypothetical protein